MAPTLYVPESESCGNTPAGCELATADGPASNQTAHANCARTCIRTSTCFIGLQCGKSIAKNLTPVLIGTAAKIAAPLFSEFEPQNVIESIFLSAVALSNRN